MTIIQKKANVLANRIVQRLWSTYWVYNEKTFEGAKSAAIIVQRMLLKEYQDGYNFGMSYDSDSITTSERIPILKALTQAIYNLKYKKR